MKVAKGNRHGYRDATMILIGFRHGLRVSELCSLQWSSIEFETGTVLCAPRQGRPGSHASAFGRRIAGPARAKAPVSLALRLCLGTWRPVHAVGFRQAARRALATKPRSASRSTRTCSGMPAATRWPTRASIPEPCRPIWATGRSTRRRATRRWRRAGSKIFGAGVALRSGLRSCGAERGYSSSVFASTSSMRAMICRECSMVRWLCSICAKRR